MKLSQFLPFENYVINTNLSVDEVIERLSLNVETRKTFLNFDSLTKQYQGEFTSKDFNISRIISYRNSFLPVILGEIKSTDGKTQIDISMNLDFKIILFLILIMVINILTNFISPIPDFIFFKLFDFDFSSIMFFLILYLVTTVAFKIESNMSKQFLADLFDVEEG